MEARAIKSFKKTLPNVEFVMHEPAKFGTKSGFLVANFDKNTKLRVLLIIY